MLSTWRCKKQTWRCPRLCETQTQMPQETRRHRYVSSSSVSGICFPEQQ